jgi:hypothetical protein
MAGMTWYTIRLDLARNEGFPEGSATHCYLLRAPLQPDGSIDAAAVAETPARATILRSWPDEPERRGYLIHSGGGWRFSYAPGEADDEPVFHLETHRLRLGEYVTITEQDGSSLCFTVSRCDAMAEA